VQTEEETKLPSEERVDRLRTGYTYSWLSYFVHKRGDACVGGR